MSALLLVSKTLICPLLGWLQHLLLALIHAFIRLKGCFPGLLQVLRHKVMSRMQLLSLSKKLGPSYSQFLGKHFLLISIIAYNKLLLVEGDANDQFPDSFMLSHASFLKGPGRALTMPSHDRMIHKVSKERFFNLCGSGSLFLLTLTSQTFPDTEHWKGCEHFWNMAKESWCRNMVFQNFKIYTLLWFLFWL